MSLVRFLGLLGLGVVALLVVTTWVYPTSAHFQPQNPFWNGLRRLAREFHPTPLTAFQDLPSSPRGTALVLIPYLPLTSQELSATREYLWQGGTLVLMDDYGNGNQVLEYLGLTARFSRAALLDPLFNYKNQWFPRMTDLPLSPLSMGVESLVLNHASSLEGTEGSSVVARSSPFSFLDRSGDGEWQEGEPVGPFPVAAYSRVGQGSLVVVADASLAISSMLTMSDNLAFIRNAIQVQGVVEKVLLDEVHLPRGALEGVKEALERGRSLLSTPWGLTGTVMAILFLSLRPWQRKEHELGKPD